MMVGRSVASFPELEPVFGNGHGGVLDKLCCYDQVYDILMDTPLY